MLCCAPCPIAAARRIFLSFRQFLNKNCKKSDIAIDEEEREVLHFKVCKRLSTIPSDGDSIASYYADNDREGQKSIVSTSSSERSTSKPSEIIQLTSNSNEKPNYIRLSLYQEEIFLQQQTDDNSKCSKENDEPIFGFIEFSVNYLEKEKKLKVSINQAVSLPPKGAKIYYDSFVRVTFLPSRKNARMTRTIKSTLNPHFREDLYFNLSKARNVNGRHLQLSLYDFDRKGRHDAIGHVILPLKEEELKVVTDHKLPLTHKSLPVENLGQLLLSFSYLESHDRLSVTVLRGRSLRLDSLSSKFPNRPIESFNSYVKITLRCSGAKVKTVRTAVVHGTSEPSYNQIFHFIVPLCFIDEASVVTTVIVKGLLRQDAVVGRVITGPYLFEQDQKLTQWGFMLQGKRAAVQWRTLFL